MGIVNIPVNVVQGVLQTPAKGNADKDNQTIRWTISNPGNSGITFPENTSPFVFPSPPPSVPPGKYSPWPGGTPTPGPGRNQWTVDVGDKLPTGTTKHYKYDINYTDGNGPQVMDPEIENQGFPGPVDEDDTKKRDPRGDGDPNASAG